MNKLVVNLQLFDLQQSIYVYDENDLCQTVIQVPTDSVVNKIKELSEIYQINKIIFCGDEKYNYGFADKLKTHFAENNIAIEFQSRG
jgi:hypothetical protein